ncbi:MAG: FAD-dependent oxidoreductase, partial [Pseudomonadota bacterium]
MSEHDVAALDDLEENALTKAEAGETEVLLIRRGEGVIALAHACSHFKLPLSKGHLDGDRLTCAFHHAAFDINTGAQLEPPGCRGIRRYESRVAEGRVLVTVRPGADPHPVPDMAGQGDDDRHFVILGAGAAGDAAALALRQEGFVGRLTMVTQEDVRPYDRTLLSKAALKSGALPDGLPLEEADVYASADIAIETGRRVRAVDPKAREITFADGETLAYDAALLALGGEARRMGAPGEDLEGVFNLRSKDDAAAIAEASGRASRVVIIGGGFIGLEAAVALAGKDGRSVTVAMPQDVPLAKVVGERVGRQLMREIEEAGVTFATGASATGFEGDGRLERVRLKDGSAIEADLALVAIGIVPAPKSIEGLPVNDEGALDVGPDMAVSGAPGLWAAGDVARFPSRWGTVRIEHWRLARQLGAVAARAMMGQEAAYEGVPFFWSALTRQLRYTGHAEDWDEIVYDGEPEDGAFVAAYMKDGRIMAALGAGRDP